MTIGIAEKVETLMTGQATRRVRRTAIGSAAILGLTASLLAAGMATAAADSGDAVTLVEVDKPGTTMITAAPFDVGQYGYVEREFFASGQAHRYLDPSGAVVGSSTPATALTQGPIAGDYRTRVIVRQPTAERFNGTLIVEWANQTTGNDGDFTFSESNDTLLTEGFAYATISPQKTGVDNIVATQPARYAGLEVEAEECDPGICPRDVMSWDIVSQVSKALKESPESPLASLGVSKIILAGQSGAGVSTVRYHNLVQPITRTFDGFLNWDGWGAEERTDLTTPFIRVSSWTVTDASPARTTFTGPFNREWQVNGSSHASKFSHAYFDDVFLRDGTQPDGRSFTEWHTAAGNCASPQPGTPVRVGQVLGAAFVAIDRWVRDGVPAPASTYFERNPDGTLVQDEHGLAVGGVQTADAAVPSVRTLRQEGSIYCNGAGQWSAYTPQELKAMYGTHSNYVAQVTAVTNAALEQGHIVASDAEKTIAAAEASDVAKTLTTASVTPRMVGPNVQMSVSVKNDDTVPVTVTVSTPFGSKTFSNLQPGQSSAVTLNARSTSITAGQITLDQSALFEGQTISDTKTIHYGVFPAAS